MQESGQENDTPESVASSVRKQSNVRVQRTIAVLVALIATLYTVEIGLLLRAQWDAYRDPALALIAPENRARLRAVRKAAEDAGNPLEDRSQEEVFADLAAEGIDAYWPSYGPALIRRRLTLRIDGNEVVPLGGISRAPVLFCNKAGGYVTYENDEHGFRNPLGLYGAGSLQIAVVGDSFACGTCIDDEYHAVALVREAYPRTLTFGIPGFGPLAAKATLVEYAAYLEPATVLWFYYEGNDVIDLRREMKHQLLPRYMEEGFSQGLRDLQTQIDGAMRSFGQAEKERLAPSERAVRNLRSWKSTLKLRNLRRELAPRFSRDDDADQTVFEVLGQILQASNDSVANWGGTMFFVYLPAFERYAKPTAGISHRDTVLRLVSEIGIPLIDVHPAFQAYPEPTELFPFGLPGHYNETGNRIVAETILEELATRH